VAGGRGKQWYSSIYCHYSLATRPFPLEIFFPELYYMEKKDEIGVDGMVNGRKTYYSISEVCGQIGLEPHVLRYWESEFPQLRPKKNRAGNRAYRDKDIEVVRYIKHLLYEEQFTIPGAKKKLSEGPVSELAAKVAPRQPESGQASVEQVKLDLAPAEPLQQGNGKLSEVKKELFDLLKVLTNSPSAAG
jgi:DNA-binding transcriptional MerR regulator